jgi:hypothetical protein
MRMIRMTFGETANPASARAYVRIRTCVCIGVDMSAGAIVGVRVRGCVSIDFGFALCSSRLATHTATRNIVR